MRNPSDPRVRGLERRIQGGQHSLWPQLIQAKERAGSMPGRLWFHSRPEGASKYHKGGLIQSESKSILSILTRPEAEAYGWEAHEEARRQRSARDQVEVMSAFGFAPEDMRLINSHRDAPLAYAVIGIPRELAIVQWYVASHGGSVGHPEVTLFYSPQAMLRAESGFPNRSVVPQPGDRIELLEMEDDPRPIEPGTLGTVAGSRRVGLEGGSYQQGGFYQISVDWDSGRGLMLSIPPDRVRILWGESE